MPSPHCLVIEHFITPTHDMHLTEYTPRALCMRKRNRRRTLACMPDAGITAEPQTASLPVANSAMCSFIQDNCGEEQSPLFAGTALSLSFRALLAWVFRLRVAIPLDWHRASRSVRRAVGARKRHLPSAP